MTAAVVLAARRTAVVPRGGGFAGLDTHHLAAPVIAALLSDCGIAPEDVGELILSNALGGGGNPARVAALAAGLPERVAGLSLDRQCAGGLDALLLADAMVRSGLHDVVIAGGAESYSLRPLRLRQFADGRAPEAYDQARFTPWADRDPEMAAAADQLARAEGISRAAQDDWACASHAKAAVPLPEIVPIDGLDHDPFRRVLSPRLCARAPVIHGDITAANMAVAADAAAFVLVTTEAKAQQLARRGMRILGGRTSGGQPDMPGLAPVAVTQDLLRDRALRTEDLAQAEIMEAFAVQAIACQQGIGVPPDIVNPQGGALARGHPIGASGTILAVRLFHALQDQPNSIGLAAIAAAGGIGTAALFQSL